MAEFDLTSQMGEYLDRHLVFPLLEFLSVKEIYDEQEMLKGKLDLLSNTNMVDFAMDVHRTLYPDQEVPAVLRNKRSEVVSELKKLQMQTDEITKIFEEVEVRNMIETARDGKQLFDFLESKYNFKHDMVDTLYKFAKFQYEIGNYSAAAEYLNFVRVLLPPSNKHGMYALWGKLASEILMQDWDAALEDLNRLKDVIESNTMATPLMLLEQRTWLIHWSLFVFFNHPKGRDLIIEMFLGQPPYLNAIQTMSPHILRYLTTAVITNKRKRHVLKELVNIIQQESYTYRDPITEFLECLYVNFDFDGAQQKLRDCEKVLVNDFFLVACIDDFIENARLLIFETFIRIHQCISISMLAEKLNMPPEDAERWIVDLIRHSPLDAKIDSKLGHVVMGTNAKSPYQQVIEKTKDLAYKSQMLVMAVEKKLRQKGGKEGGYKS